MTVIVKPVAPPVNSSDEVISTFLSDLLGTLTFPAFEAMPNGNITVLYTTFRMRIGTFLGMANQAIMAEGQFVKMQHRNEYKTGYGLKPLDAKSPDDCLYVDVGTAKAWQPQPDPPFDPIAKAIAQLEAKIAEDRRICAPVSLIAQSVALLAQLQAQRAARRWMGTINPQAPHPITPLTTQFNNLSSYQGAHPFTPFDIKSTAKEKGLLGNLFSSMGF